MELWQKLHYIADRAQPQFQWEFVKFVRKMASSVNIRKIREAVKSGNAQFAWDALDWDKVMQTEFSPQIKKAMLGIMDSAGTAAMKDLIGVEGSFNVMFPEVITAVNTRAGRLITSITDQTRKGITDAVREAFLDGRGVPKDRIFNIIESAANIRDELGLNQRQMASLRKFRTNLAQRGYTGAQYDKMVGRYRWKLLKQRASMIARTETIEASCEGQRLAWDQAVSEGRIDKNNMEVEWIVTPDDVTCDRCNSMKGARRPIGGVYQVGFGAGTTGPTLHPNCRCGENLVQKIAVVGPVQPTVLKGAKPIKPKVVKPKPKPKPAPQPKMTPKQKAQANWKSQQQARVSAEKSVKEWEIEKASANQAYFASANQEERTAAYKLLNRASVQLEEARATLSKVIRKERGAFYKTVPFMDEETYLETRLSIVEEMTVIPSDVTPGKYSAMKLASKKGTDMYPLDVLDTLREKGVKINWHNSYNRAWWGQNTSNKVEVFANDGYVTVAHEVGHAVDDVIFGAKHDLYQVGGSGTGFRWTNNPWVKAEDGKRLAGVYKSIHTKEIGTYTNGDGNYWKDNWIRDYEGRIYPWKGGTDGPEWWTMNCQRYAEYLNKASTYDKILAGYRERAAAGSMLGQAGVEELVLKGKAKWAARETEWYLVQDRYPELAKFIEEKFAEGTRILGRW